jgi:hypothetical protein
MISCIDNGFFMTLLNIQEVFAAIVAAAIHDFKHMVGVYDMYFINSMINGPHLNVLGQIEQLFGQESG